MKQEREPLLHPLAQEDGIMNRTRDTGDLSGYDLHTFTTMMRNQYRVDLTPLSPREIEVFQLVRQGLSNNGVASTLFISERTAQTHLGNIFSKVPFSTRYEIFATLSDEEAVPLAPPIDNSLWNKIVPSEWDILAHLANGLSHEAIAQKTKNRHDKNQVSTISIKTVHKHFDNILEKLRVPTREQALLAYKARRFQQQKQNKREK